MVDVTLPAGCMGYSRLPRQRTLLENCFNNGSGAILQRPGITTIKDIGGNTRGQFLWNDSIYQVINDELIRINNEDTGSNQVIGTISGHQAIDFAAGYNHGVIVVKGGSAYTLTGGTTLATITDGLFKESDSVEHMNGRFVYTPTNGDPALYSAVGDGSTIDGFFDAEELPDKNKANWQQSNTMYIAGTDSIELFRAPSSGTNPFARVPNGRIETGYIGGKLKYGGTHVFIGREEGQDVGVFAIAQGAAEKISNEYIDEILITYTEAELGLCVSSRFKWRGYDIATFTLSRHSFGFYGGMWFILSTQDADGDNGLWSGGYLTYHNGKYFSGNAGMLGYLSNDATDYGFSFKKLMEYPVEIPDEDMFSAQAVQLAMSQGFNSAVGSVAIQISRDGVNFSEPYFRNTGDVGEYDQKLIWNPPGGIGNFYGFMKMRIWTADDIEFSATKMTVDAR